MASAWVDQRWGTRCRPAALLSRGTGAHARFVMAAAAETRGQIFLVPFSLASSTFWGQMIRGQRKRQKGERERAEEGGREGERKKRARDPAERGSEQEVTFPFLPPSSPRRFAAILLRPHHHFRRGLLSNRRREPGREGREAGRVVEEGGKADINDRRKV